MTDKTRIVETQDGVFMPQFWRGWFRGWAFLVDDADAGSFGFPLVVALEARDPATAARFASEAEAKAFLDRLNARVAAYWRRTFEAEARAREGVSVKRVVR